MSARDARLLTVLSRTLGHPGSPVARNSHQERAEIAHTALRHIQGLDARGLLGQTFAGRGMRMPGREQERLVADFAKSLLARAEKDPERAARLAPDMRKLAEALLRAFVAVPPETPPAANSAPLDEPGSSDEPAPTQGPADA
jgi:hypothetical protein